MALALGLAAGCASAPKPKLANNQTRGSTFESIQQENLELARRLSELETRIALLEQEARLHKAAYKPTETVRIGKRSEQDDEGDQPALSPVTVVRLHEESRRAPELEPLVLPEPPPGIATSLPVVPLPGERAFTSDALPVRDPQTQYREGLSLLKERRYSAAIEQFEGLARNHPDHPLVGPAMYWEGEAHYAERRYLDALHAFQGVVQRFPKSAKAPEALLKAGLCHMRLGQRDEAQRYFEQVQQQFPHSEAAQSVPREGST